MRSRVNDIAHVIECDVPLRWQEDFDNAGMQVGDPEAEVSGVLLCTDVTMAVVDEAIARRFNMVVSHHPLIFHGLKKVAGRNITERIVARAISNGINIYSAHTNLDNAPHGVSWHMASKLGLTGIETLEAHDDNGTTIGLGVIATMEETCIENFLRDVVSVFSVRALRYGGDPRQRATHVAFCGGSGAFLIDRARQAGAQVFVTADVKYHEFFKADEGIVIADIGHYESERFAKELLRDIISSHLPKVSLAMAESERNPVSYLT